MRGNLRECQDPSGYFLLNWGATCLRIPLLLPVTPSFVADSQVPPLGWRLVNEFTHQKDVVCLSLCGMLDSSVDKSI